MIRTVPQIVNGVFPERTALLTEGISGGAICQALGGCTAGICLSYLRKQMAAARCHEANLENTGSLGTLCLIGRLKCSA